MDKTTYYEPLPYSQLKEIRDAWYDSVENSKKLSKCYLHETKTGNRSILGHLLEVCQKHTNIYLPYKVNNKLNCFVYEYCSFQYNTLLPDPIAKAMDISTSGHLRRPYCYKGLPVYSLRYAMDEQTDFGRQSPIQIADWLKRRNIDGDIVSFNDQAASRHFNSNR